MLVENIKSSDTLIIVDLDIGVVVNVSTLVLSSDPFLLDNHAEEATDSVVGSLIKNGCLAARKVQCKR